MKWPLSADFFRLSGEEKGNNQVRCPFHGDTTPSASVNWQYGLFNCFARCGGKKLDEVEEFLRQRQPTAGETEEDSTEEVEVHVNDGGSDDGPADLLDYGEQYLRARGFDPEEMGVTVEVEDEPGARLYGYLILTSADGRYSARNLLDNGRPKYIASSGEKPGVWMVGEDDPARPLWLVEGTLDAVALYQLGVRPVGTPLGTKGLTEDMAFGLRGRTVFVLFDADAAGYKGAREAQAKLAEFGVNGIILDFPRKLGSDPAEAFEKDRDALKAWLDAQRAEIGANDEGYVSRLFTGGGKTLRTLPTGIPSWDALLGGGMSEGVHVIGAEPGVGKSCLALERATAWAEAGSRALYVTYEIPKQQSWARIASVYDKHTWARLEKEPSLVSKKTLEKLQELAVRVRVAVGWDIGRISHVAHNFDVIIIDYLQRMPGPFGADEKKNNVTHNIERLSNLARDEGKIVVVVSSLPRSHYGNNNGGGWMKESGNVEYVAQSATKLTVAGENMVAGEITKNTRGRQGAFWMQTDLGHLRFCEGAPAPKPKVNLG